MTCMNFNFSSSNIKQSLVQALSMCNLGLVIVVSSAHFLSIDMFPQVEGAKTACTSIVSNTSEDTGTWYQICGRMCEDHEHYNECILHTYLGLAALASRRWQVGIFCFATVKPRRCVKAFFARTGAAREIAPIGCWRESSWYKIRLDKNHFMLIEPMSCFKGTTTSSQYMQNLQNIASAEKIIGMNVDYSATQHQQRGLNR